MKTDKILQNITSCTINEDADIDDYNNHYYNYPDVVKAIDNAAKIFADWITANGFEGYYSDGKSWWQRVNDHHPFSTNEIFEMFNESKP
jgi:hypothetical protein